VAQRDRFGAPKKGLAFPVFSLPLSGPNTDLLDFRPQWLLLKDLHRKRFPAITQFPSNVEPTIVASRLCYLFRTLHKARLMILLFHLARNVAIAVSI
jgi:hypothetical protein